MAKPYRMRRLYYFFPVLVTFIFIAILEVGMYIVLPFILPAVTTIGKLFGKFTSKEVWEEYFFFHHAKIIEYITAISGFFFIGFNIYLGYFIFNHPLSFLNLFLIIYSAIIFNSNFSAALAHELMHSEAMVNRFLGKTLLLINGFFYLENDHLHIHHPHIGTPFDPASALYNESLYRYWLRSIIGRIKILFFKDGNIKKSLKANWESLLNFLICMSILVAAYFLNTSVFLWILFQFIGVTFIYETITYIQHYGLRRNKATDGKYETIKLNHSWNCYYKYSAFLHYCMPVHALHHLRTINEQDNTHYPGPEFPYSFGHMVLLAFFPKWWFRTMNPKILSAKKLFLANA